MNKSVAYLSGGAFFIGLSTLAYYRRNELKGFLSNTKLCDFFSKFKKLDSDLFIPDNANEGCPGIADSNAGKLDTCKGCPNASICASGEALKQDASVEQVNEKLSNIKKVILVLSGKGGVGKSTVASQLAWALSIRKLKVGLLDIDICGPSIPRMTGLTGQDVHLAAEGWSPVYASDNLAVMSVGFLLPNEDDAVIWRGPKKNGLIKQFLTDVNWGDLDILLVDTPPGTSDEHLSVITYLKDIQIDGALLVTTPQEVSLQDVRKEINFCHKVGVKIIGVIENMSESVFSPTTGGAQAMCSKMKVPFLTSIPLDRSLCESCEQGKPIAEVFPESIIASSFNWLADSLREKIML